MNRFLLMMLAASLSFSIAACGDDEDPKPGEEVDCTETPDDPSCDQGGDEGITELPAELVGLCADQLPAYAAIKDQLADIATPCALANGATEVDAEDPAALAALQVAVANCIAEEEGVEIDATCAVCTSEVVACAVINCLAVCADGGEDCEECRETNGCDANVTVCVEGEDDGNDDGEDDGDDDGGDDGDDGGDDVVEG